MSKVTEERLIPQVIVHSGKTQIKARYSRGYIYHAFDEKRARVLIKEHFGEKELTTYDSLEGDGKFDLWKFCFLYVNGGVYIREDLDLLDHIDELVSAPETLYYDSNFNVSDRLIAVQKNNPVMSDAISLLCNRTDLLEDENTALNVLDKIPDSLKTDPEKVAQMCIATEQEIDIHDVAQLKSRMKWWATGPILLNDVVYSRVTGKILNCSEYILPPSLKERIVRQVLRGSIDDVCVQLNR